MKTATIGRKRRKKAVRFKRQKTVSGKTLQEKVLAGKEQETKKRQ